MSVVTGVVLAWNRSQTDDVGAELQRGTTPAIDPANNLVAFSTGNPIPDLDGTNRKGDNICSGSIVGQVLDLDIGKLR